MGWIVRVLAPPDAADKDAPRCRLSPRSPAQGRVAAGGHQAIPIQGARRFYGRRRSPRDRQWALSFAFEDKSGRRIDRADRRHLTLLKADSLARVNATILSRTGSEVDDDPEVANHLISSGGKRLRPMLTLATASSPAIAAAAASSCAASVEFMHTATLLHDDVVDESEMRRGKPAAPHGLGQRGERARSVTSCSARPSR